MQVVPLTSSVERLYPSEAYVQIGGRTGKAMTDQLTTVSKIRLRKSMGALSESDLKSVERAAKTQLGL